jgi:2-oxoisovalerate dehydrogenase E2 component (dihydrolipoyl transacylase)
MPIQVLMPQFGESVEEATITKWLKAEGDRVEEFEALVEVNTDKVDTEIPAPAAGILLKIAQPDEGSTVKVGMLLAWIGEPGEPIPEDKSASETETHAQISEGEEIPSVAATPHSDSLDSPPEVSPRNVGFISPVVSKIAAEHRVDLQLVNGTGLNGRITKKDLLNYIESNDQGISKQASTEISLHPTPTPAADAGFAETVIPHSTMRRRIAEHMLESKRTSPHVTTVFEADLSKVVAHRQFHKAAFEQDGIKLTYTAYFLAAAATALKAYPIVNSSWSDDGLILHRKINIGMATSLGEEGLIVPVVRRADELSLRGIARSVNDLANRARTRQLKPDEVSGGTFSITNHGVSGSLFAMPIINQPQCAILGIGKLQKRVVVLADDSGYDTIAVRPMVYLTLTFDHRILDGAVADYFLAKVVETLENWV